MSKLLQSLPESKRVLKADILRYTILLHKGGIYSDFYTAAVKEFDEWGRGAIHMVSRDTISSSWRHSRLYSLINHQRRRTHSLPKFRGCNDLPLPSSLSSLRPPTPLPSLFRRQH